MTRHFKTTILMVLSWTLTGCGFAYQKELIDNYFLVATDVGEQMSLDYNDDRGSVYFTVISATVFEAKWNDRFIVVKAHPEDIRKSLEEIYRNLHFKGGILDKINTKGYYTQQEWDEIHKVDSLAERDADSTVKSNNFANAKGQITLYYLLDTKNNNQHPLLFLTERELEKAMQENQVGKLNHEKYFEDLDK